MVISKRLLAILVCYINHINAAPRPEEFLEQVITRTQYVSASSTARGYAPRSETIPTKLHAENIESLLLAPWTLPPDTTTSNSMSNYQQYPFSFSYMTPTASVPIPQATTTVTVIKEEPTTITVTANPTTITEVMTITKSSSASLPSPSTRPDIKQGSAKAVWNSPPDMIDLSSFQVSKFAGGENNIKIVKGVPAVAKGLGPLSFGDPSIFSQGYSSPDQWNSSSSAMQLLYPARSIDPAQKPQGGAEFYASPIDISRARNVTMGYSVFFPKDFNWVLGGKLPGLYGGHTGCSGGNAALDCFSTRLMWRQGGAGELYLYAPKDKQTKALCADPASVCDAAYGLSVGRGMFNWQPGSWTTVEQTIYLNTAGKQDGHFTLVVNGERAIFRDDVFYREDVNKKETDKTTKTTQAKTTSTKKHAEPTTSSTDDGDDGGILGPLLGGILGGLRREEITWEEDQGVREPSVLLPGLTKVANTEIQMKTAPLPRPTAEPATATMGVEMSLGIESMEESEVKFVGIFFSTFFGGHEPKYATPQDQYVWFKDFSLSYNA